MSPERAKSVFENISLSMRFVLPALAFAYFYAYQGDMHAIKDSISEVRENQKQNVMEVKNSQSQIWKTLSDFKDTTNAQFFTIYQRLPK